MLYFPQLETGAMAEYPVTKRRLLRTVVNELPDGTAICLTDADAAVTEWELRFPALTDAEWQAIADLFQQVEGQLGTFVFVDPCGNLFAASEDLRASAWAVDPMLRLSDSLPDPFGGNRAWEVVNTGQAPQRIMQSLSAPGWFHYSFSVYARSPHSSTVRMTQGTDTASQSQDFELRADWQRLCHSCNLQSRDEIVRFALEIPAGSLVEIFGLQCEPQPNPSSYKRSDGRGGIYRKARFKTDSLPLLSEGPGHCSTVVQIWSGPER